MLDYLNKNRSEKVGANLLKCFDRALSGLQYMHDLGIAHMDIKLENILLDTNNDQVKLIDLGQAQVFVKEGEYQTNNRVCGTEAYFPPEFYNRLYFYPDKVDIWCCGIVLYNLIFDRMPWGLSYRKDPLFARCEEYFKSNKLYPKCFNKSSYKIPELTDKDAKILEDIFFSVFNLFPKLRPDICELRSRLQQLSVFNEQHSQVDLF
uniref:non-specific serine/threonine protein kinase n=1 Tax=viral metagenome TaxID=1070528 RepID=A0A6C0H6Y5_9ZZZZ